MEISLDTIFLPDFLKIMSDNLDIYNDERDKNTIIINEYIHKINAGVKNLDEMYFTKLFIKSQIYSIMEFYYKNKQDFNKIYDFITIHSIFPLKGIVINKYHIDERKVYSDFIMSLISFANKMLKIIIIRFIRPMAFVYIDDKDIVFRKKLLDVNTTNLTSILDFEISNDKLIKYCNDHAFEETSCKKLINEVMFLYKVYKKNTDENVVSLNTGVWEFYSIFYFMKYHNNVCDQTQLEKLNADNKFSLSDFTILISHSKYSSTYNSNVTYKEYKINDEIMFVRYNKNLSTLISKCLDKFIVLTITLELISIHINILIYNPAYKEVEIYEPDTFYNKNLMILYKIIVNDLFPLNVRYVPHNEYITEFIQDTQVKECNSLEPSLCVNWVTWYADQRLNYPELNAVNSFRVILEKLHNKKKTENMTLTDIILEFTKLFKSRRDLVLKDTNVVSERLGNNIIRAFEAYNT